MSPSCQGELTCCGRILTKEAGIKPCRVPPPVDPWYHAPFTWVTILLLMVIMMMLLMMMMVMMMLLMMMGATADDDVDGDDGRN